MPNNQFKDQSGRQWVVRITNRSVRDVRDKLAIDIRELLNDDCKPLLALISDSLRLSEILFLLCASQAKELGIDEDDFLDSIYGDSAETASKAFCAAFVDFFPNAQLRSAITKMLGLAVEMRSEIAKQASDLVSATVESTDVTSIASSIVSPESSA